MQSVTRPTPGQKIRKGTNFLECTWICGFRETRDGPTDKAYCSYFSQLKNREADSARGALWASSIIGNVHHHQNHNGPTGWTKSLKMNEGSEWLRTPMTKERDVKPKVKRLKCRSKAVYKAASVACCWTGVVIQLERGGGRLLSFKHKTLISDRLTYRRGRDYKEILPLKFSWWKKLFNLRHKYRHVVLKHDAT